MLRASNIIALSMIVVAASCREAEVSQPRSLRYEAAEGLPHSAHSYDDALIAIADSVAGFGGFYLDRQQPVVVLTDTTKLAQALTAMKLVVGDIPSRIKLKPIAKLGRYDFRDLSRWRDEFVGNARLIPIYMVDADERVNRVRLGVRTDADAQKVTAFAQSHEIPIEAMLIDVAPAPVMTQSYITSQLRPVPAGASEIHQTASSYNGCTHGANVTKLSYPGSYFLVNSHCTKYWSRNDTTLFYQPLVGGIYYEGYEVIDVSPQPASSCPGTVYAYVYPCRAADVALIRADPDSIVDLYTVARTTFNTVGPTGTSGSLQIDSLNPKWTFITYDDRWWDLVAGDSVSKVGVGTGWTSGAITSTCTDYFVAPPNDPAGLTYRLWCQWEFDGNVRGGDSSSPVFSIRSSTTAAFSGILWGCANLCSPTSNAIGYGGLFSPYDNITSELGAIYVF